MKFNFNLLLSSILTFTLVACGGSHIIIGNARTPTRPADVKIYSTPPAKYDEIALVEGSSEGTFATTNQQKTNQALEYIKEEAAKVGANGVLLSGWGELASGSGAVITPTNSTMGVLIVESHVSLRGKAIYVLP